MNHDHLGIELSLFLLNPTTQNTIQDTYNSMTLVVNKSCAKHEKPLVLKQQQIQL